MGGCVEKRNNIIINQSILLRKNCFKNISFSFKERSSNTSLNEKPIFLLKNKSQRIPIQIWINILNYLNFYELKETGKVNKFFNKSVKRKEILVKFFKKRDSIFIQNNKKNIEELYIHTVINNFISFSMLQKSNYSYQDDYSYDSVNINKY
jgi:hypothetical protein